MISKKNKMIKSNEALSTSVNLICEGTTINGDIEGEKDFRIDGKVIGTLKIKGKVVIGETGKIEGDIFCKTLDILGYVTGNLKVSELVAIKEGAVVKGDIFSNKVAVQPGAKIIGACSIGNVDKETTTVKTTTKSKK